MEFNRESGPVRPVYLEASVIKARTLGCPSVDEVGVVICGAQFMELVFEGLVLGDFLIFGCPTISRVRCPVLNTCYSEFRMFNFQNL